MNDRTAERDETVGAGRRPRSVRYALLSAVCVLVLGVYAWRAESGFLELWSSKPENNYYNLLVRGFQSGQLNLKRETPPGLAQLSGPSDPAADLPDKSDPFGPQDLSYYKGKLYFYFGVTPALMLFWPYAALTGHYLLHKDAVVVFFSVGFLASVGLLWGIWRRYFSEVGVGVVAACALAVGWANFVLVCLPCAGVYEVAISCGYALVMVALVLLWQAMHAAQGQGWWLAGASLAYGLAVGARPSLLFGAVILLVPVVWGRQKAEDGRESFSFAIWLAATAPIALIGLGLMLYNFMRFDDPFEFGHRYALSGAGQQIVQSQYNAQPFSLRFFWFNFQVYFLAPARWSGHFPFVQDIAAPGLPQGHVGIAHAFGVLPNLPLVCLALAAPLAWRGRAGGPGRVLRWFGLTLVLLFGSCALTLCLFFAACFRYQVDFLPALVLLAVLGILGLEQKLAGRPVRRRAARLGWGLLLAFSAAFNLFTMFERTSDFYVYRGIISIQKGQLDQAVGNFQRALAWQFDNAKARTDLGSALFQQDKRPEAIRCFEEALRLRPDDAEAHMNLGAALLHQGKEAEGLAHLEQALRLKPDLPEGHDKLGIALLQLNRVPEAVGHLEQALRLNPKDAEANNNLGIALFKLGKIQEAIVRLEQALRLKPKYAGAHYNLGKAMQRLGRVTEAIEQYEQTLQLQPDDIDAHKNLGITLFQQGKVLEAVGHLEQALRLKPEDPEVHNNLGVALFQQGKVSEAMEHLEQALRLKPDLADAHGNLEKALLQQGKVTEAIGHLGQALRLQPENLEVQNKLAWVLATYPDGAARNGARAVELAEGANKLAGNKDAVILKILAAAYAEAGRFPEAVVTVRQALQLARAQNNQALADELQRHLALYQSGSPLRDSGSSSAPVSPEPALKGQ